MRKFVPQPSGEVLVDPRFTANRPGLATASVLVAAGLYADKELLERGYWTISSAVRHSRVAKGVVIYLALHFLRDWRYDPARLMVKRLAQRKI